MEKRALGKGLSALIGTQELPAFQEAGAQSPLEIAVAKIRPNRFQPREVFDDQPLADLIASIRENGIVQPVLVRPVENGYELIAGERRYRAAQALGMEKIPVTIKTVTDAQALALSLIENIQREQLNAIEESKAYTRLLEEFNYTQEELSTVVGKSRSTIANTIRLQTLPGPVQTYIGTGTLTGGHARALLALPTEKEQITLSEQIVKDGLSVRAVEALVARKQIGRAHV